MKNKVIVTACALLAMTTASAQNAYDAETVSYTHLTLPTICSV